MFRVPKGIAGVGLTRAITAGMDPPPAERRPAKPVPEQLEDFLGCVCATGFYIIFLVAVAVMLAILLDFLNWRPRRGLGLG